MPIQPDEEQRIAQLRAELLKIGLDWNKQYRLVDEGEQWALDLLRPTSAEQYHRAQELLERIMNCQ
jgi:hypothetical protein